jgi:hypothetical protein
VEVSPLVVFHDDEAYWLAESFYRFSAAREAELETIACEVRSGSLRDAILRSAGANATHGLHRSNADKRRAVLLLLKMRSGRPGLIARLLGVVRLMERRSLACGTISPAETPVSPAPTKTATATSRRCGRPRPAAGLPRCPPGRGRGKGHSRGRRQPHAPARRAVTAATP